MYTKVIGGTTYRLIKIPTNTRIVEAMHVCNEEYTWLHCDKHIRKRVNLDLTEWDIISPVAMLTEKKCYQIGVMALTEFVCESGMSENIALLLVKRKC